MQQSSSTHIVNKLGDSCVSEEKSARFASNKKKKCCSRHISRGHVASRHQTWLFRFAQSRYNVLNRGAMQIH